MLDYIRFDESIPILSQLPGNFKSAAILLHPFVEMPSNWTQYQRKNPYEHIYPSNEEILKKGKPVGWEKIIRDCGYKNPKELAIALKTSICALKKEYARPDFAERLKLEADVYYPEADSISVFLIDSLIKVLSSNGANTINYSEPIFDKCGTLSINEMKTLDVCNITSNELIITDEKMDFAFMSLYDSFFTLFVAKDKNIIEITESMDCEAIICTNETIINWYW